MLDILRTYSSSALSFALRVACLLLLLAGAYTVYRFADSLPEGHVAQGKLKFKLVDYERDSSPSVIVIDKTPAPPVANASCGSSTPCGRCNTGCDNTQPQQPSQMVQTISINTAAAPSTTTTPAPRPVAPPPAPKPVETATCGN
jgi:hypothetical protein